MSENTPILEVKDVTVEFQQSTNVIQSLLSMVTGTQDVVRAVDSVSIELTTGDIIGVIGESGCGKTTLLNSMVQIPDIAEGEIYYKGDPISSFNRSEMKNFRSNVQKIFQDPYGSLDPKMTVRETLEEPLHIHDVSYDEETITSMLERVELSPPTQYLDKYPSQISGGEKQRVSIARALIIEPEIILADEPVSMLDVSTQASILNLLEELTDEFDLAMMYVSHDLSTIAHICSRVNVMYLGRFVESAEVSQIVDGPLHPYTQELINAIPVPDPYSNRKRTVLKQTPPDPIGLGEGCRFRERCPERMDVCEETPCFLRDEKDHGVACHLYYDHENGDFREGSEVGRLHTGDDVNTGVQESVGQ